MNPKVRTKKERLEKPLKQYAPDQCALYGIKGVGQLMRVLRWRGTRAELEAFDRAPGSYRFWANEQGREIQAAGAEMRKLHARVAVLLRRIMPPEYRQSGVRKRSFLTNAQFHTLDEPSVKLDIKSFYPSTTFAHVRRFFQNDMKCAGDVAFLLAKMCCVNQRHLPTGGVHSEVLAFYCHRNAFEQLYQRAKARGGVMTVYVDDIMMTMPRASLTDLEWARRLFANHGIKIHPGKSKVLAKAKRKTITGVDIHRGKISAPKAQHQLILQRHVELNAAVNPTLAVTAARSLLGHLDHVAQIEPRFRSRAEGTRAWLAAVLAETDAPGE
nr:reverse transcriptase family protein [Luteibacter rhizovicinus]